MRPASLLALLGLCFLGSGCALVEDTARNALVTLARPVERHREEARNRAWAEQAWQQACSCDATPRSADYADGFRDGYTELLFRGGDGEPPLLAPLRYRGVRYQTPQGYAAISDWFAGYRQGAAAAKASGARELITGPSSLRAHGPPAPLPVVPPPVVTPAAPPMPPAPAVLPPPRTLSEASSGKSSPDNVPVSVPAPLPRARFGTPARAAVPLTVRTVPQPPQPTITTTPPLTVTARPQAGPRLMPAPRTVLTLVGLPSVPITSAPVAPPPLNSAPAPGRLLLAIPQGVLIPEVIGWPNKSGPR